jgi:hypothetical protein
MGDLLEISGDAETGLKFSLKLPFGNTGLSGESAAKID